MQCSYSECMLDAAGYWVQAAQRGLRYQTYLKMLIHEALQREESGRAGR